MMQSPKPNKENKEANELSIPKTELQNQDDKKSNFDIMSNNSKRTKE